MNDYTINLNTQFTITAETYEEALQILNNLLDSVGAEKYRETYLNGNGA